jgi:hypothetical protein
VPPTETPPIVNEPEVREPPRGSGAVTAPEPEKAVERKTTKKKSGGGRRAEPTVSGGFKAVGD